MKCTSCGKYVESSSNNRKANQKVFGEEYPKKALCNACLTKRDNLLYQQIMSSYFNKLIRGNKQ